MLNEETDRTFGIHTLDLLFKLVNGILLACLKAKN